MDLINTSLKKDKEMRRLYHILFLILLSFAACESENRTTDTRSTKFSQEGEKIAFLKRYVKLFSPVSAAEYHIVYHDNSGGLLPGPSEWDIKIALVIAPSDVPKWIAGFREAGKDECDLSWVREIPLEGHPWIRGGRPRCYLRPGTETELVVYGKEGILFKRMRSY